jgi:hypothetical protein
VLRGGGARGVVNENMGKSSTEWAESRAGRGTPGKAGMD